MSNWTFTTFGSGDGQTISDEDPTFQDANEILNGSVVAIAPDGKIVVAGDYGYRINQLDVMILRFLGEGTTAARAKFDFDGDGKANVSVFRPSSGAWYVLGSTAGFYTASRSGNPATRRWRRITTATARRMAAYFVRRAALGI